MVDQLVRRRAVEKALFLAPPEGFTPVPSAVLKPTFDHSVIGAAVAWAAARERTAVSRLALEGPDVSSGLAIPPGREGEPAPSAAIAAADALTVRLSRILPEDMPEPGEAPQQAPEPLALQSDPAPPEPPPVAVAVTPAPLDLQAPPRPANWMRQSFTQGSALIPDVNATLALAPTAPPEAVGETAEPTPAHFVEAPSTTAPGGTETEGVEPLSFADGPPEFLRSPFDKPLFDTPPAQPAVAFEPPPTPRFDSPIFEMASAETPSVEDAPTIAPPAALLHPIEEEAFATVEPPPFVEPDEAEPASEASPFRRRFGARIANAMQTAASPAAEDAAPVETPSLFDAPAPTLSFDDTAQDPTSTALEPSPQPAAVVPLFERPAFFFALGLLGVALFAGSIFCMLNKASFTCLLIGVVGVLAMAPAAAFFLFRFLGAPIDHDHADHAEMLSMMREPAATKVVDGEPTAEQAEPSAFDRVEWR